MEDRQLRRAPAEIQETRDFGSAKSVVPAEVLGEPRRDRNQTIMSLTDPIRSIQKKLGTEADGKPGPTTWVAIHLAIVGKTSAEDASLDATIHAFA